jgi:hypothetical protein
VWCPIEKKKDWCFFYFYFTLNFFGGRQSLTQIKNQKQQNKRQKCTLSKEMDPEVDFGVLHSTIVEALKNPAIPQPESYACRPGFWLPFEHKTAVDEMLTTVSAETYDSCLHSVVESGANNGGGGGGETQSLDVTYLLTQKADPSRGLLIEVKRAVNCYVWGVEPQTPQHASTIPELLAISYGHKDPEFVVSRARAGADVRLGFVDLAVDPDRAPFKLSDLQKTKSGDLMATVAHHSNKPWVDRCDLKLVFPKGSTAQTKTHLHFDDMTFKYD